MLLTRIRGLLQLTLEVQTETKLGQTREKNNAYLKAEVNRLLKSMEDVNALLLE